MTKGLIQTEMEALLSAAFSPTHLAVINDSGKHRGHSGDDGSGESHFRVLLRAGVFAGVPRIERHRAVHRALGADLTARIHALALDLDG